MDHVMGLFDSRADPNVYDRKIPGFPALVWSVKLEHADMFKLF